MEELDLKEIFYVFWEKKIYIALITTCFILLGLVYSFVYVMPEYSSDTSLLLAQNENSSASNTISQTDLTLNQRLVSTYSELIKSKNVLREVLSNLQGENVSENMSKVTEGSLRGKISVSYVTNTDIIKITVKDRDPKVAKDIANEISSVFRKKVADIYKINNVYVIDVAEESTVPSNVNHIRDIVLFVMVGLIVSFGIMFVHYMLNTSIRTAEDVEKATKLPVLAEIPKVMF